MVYFLYAVTEIKNNLASHLNAFQFIAATFCLGPYPYLRHRFDTFNFLFASTTLSITCRSSLFFLLQSDGHLNDKQEPTFDCLTFSAR